MAKWHLFFPLLLIVAAGCQQQQTPPSIVDNLPGPNFTGPVFDPRPVVVVPPSLPAVAMAPQPVVPLQRKAAAPDAVPAEWLPSGAINQWNWIVIHHSATADGGASRFNKMHLGKHWDELGYHFVIGNGTDTADGQIEVGPRWPKQKWGAHDNANDNRYNEHGIGICLVGNFDVAHPSVLQLRSLERLVAYLMKTYHIPASRVIGHGETKATECPGKNLNVADVRQACAKMIAGSEGGNKLNPNPGDELLVDNRSR
jgi:hypothetical protein